VPGEERAGGDGEDRGPAVAGDQRGEGCQPESVGLFVADRAFELAAQDGVLVPRDQQFGVFGGVPAQWDCWYGQQRAGSALEQRHDHGDSIPAANYAHGQYR
jgi:hypothetical protein